MKLLLDIALGKSIYTVYFFVVLAISIVLALYLESVLAINIALVLVCVFGVFTSVSAVVSTNEAIESLGWPNASAKLVSCRVATFSTLKFNGSKTQSSSPGVQYSFEVGGQTYTGNSYILGQRTYSEREVEKIISDVKSKGDSLLVSYDPADPSMNVLKPGINEVHYVRALVGVGIIGLTVSELFGWTHFI